MGDIFARIFLLDERIAEKRAEYATVALRPDAQVILDNILDRVEATESGCWEWQGASTAKGYGRVRIDRKLYLPHRVVAWAMGMTPTLGDPSRKTIVLHTCDNPKCCNPAHLRAGTLSDNMIDCAQKGRVNKQKRPWQPKKPPRAPDPPILYRGKKRILTPRGSQSRN